MNYIMDCLSELYSVIQIFIVMFNQNSVISTADGIQITLGYLIIAVAIFSIAFNALVLIVRRKS